MFTLQYGWDFKHPPSTTLLPFLLWTRPCHFSWGGDFSSLLIPAAWLRILLRMIPSAFGCFNTSVSIAKWHLSILAVKKVALREWSFRLIIFYCSDVFLTVWISILYIWAFSHFIGLKETTCMSVLECNAPFANFIISAGDDVGHEVVSCNPWLIWSDERADTNPFLMTFGVHFATCTNFLGFPDEALILTKTSGTGWQRCCSSQGRSPISVGPLGGRHTLCVHFGHDCCVFRSMELTTFAVGAWLWVAPSFYRRSSPSERNLRGSFLFTNHFTFG